MKISEKSEEGRNIFSLLVCKGAADKCKIAAENEAVAVQNIYCFIVKSFCELLFAIRTF
jgi:hypothetical protein